MSAIVARQPGALSLSARRGQSVVGSGCGRLVRQTATTAAAPRCLSARAPRVTTSTALLTPHPPALLSALLPSRSPSFPLLLPVVLSSRFSNLVLERHELAPHWSWLRSSKMQKHGSELAEEQLPEDTSPFVGDRTDFSALQARARPNRGCRVPLLAGAACSPCPRVRDAVTARARVTRARTQLPPLRAGLLRRGRGQWDLPRQDRRDQGVPQARPRAARPQSRAVCALCAPLRLVLRSE